MSEDKKDITLSKEKYVCDLEYYWEKDRLDSFTHWPFSDKHKCNPRKMAEAGFYYCGSEDEPDLAKCFFCKKELNGWEPNDDPWLEHSKHTKHCIFLKYNRPEAYRTVEQHVQLIKLCYEILLEKKYEKMVKEMENIFDDTIALVKSKKKW